MEFFYLRIVGCGIFRSQKCGMSGFREVGGGFFGKINVGCGILWPKICGMLDFLSKTMWDVGF